MVLWCMKTLHVLSHHIYCGMLTVAKVSEKQSVNTALNSILIDSPQKPAKLARRNYAEALSLFFHQFTIMIL